MSVDRPEWVTVAFSRGTVAVPPASRDALLEEIRPLDSLIGVRRAFEAAGASGTVRLAREDLPTLIQVIEIWMRNVRGPDRLPEGIFELRNAAVGDLHDAAE